MANNEEEQNKVEEAKETIEQAKEVSKLAANAASGNVIGAAKNAVKLLKDKNFKKKLKRKLIMIALQAMIPIIIAACLLGAINAIKDEMIALLANAGTSVGGFLTKAWQWLTDDFWIKLDDGIEYIIDMDTGETLGRKDTITDADLLNEKGEPRNTTTKVETIVDQYVRDLGNQGVSLEALRLLGDADYSHTDKLLENEENKALVEKYISEFIRADVITQQPHRRDHTELVNKNNQNWIDGGIYIYRTKKEPTIDEDKLINGEYHEENVSVEDKDYKQMTYMKYDEFQEKLQKNDKGLRYKFTINPDNGNLILAEIKSTVTKTGKAQVGDGWFSSITNWLADLDIGAQQLLNKKEEYELKSIEVDYKQLISKYTMPYEFLVQLCEITQNPEFVYHVALLARNTKIVLVVQDNTTVERETVETESDMQYYRNYNDNSVAGASGNTYKQKERTVIITTTQTPVLQIDYADTWSFYEEFEYTKNIEGTLTEEGPIEKSVASGSLSLPSTLSGYHPAEDFVGQTITQADELEEYWYDTVPVKTTTMTQTITTITTYNEPFIKNTVEKSKQFLGLLRNDTGTCPYDNCFEEKRNPTKGDPIALYCAQEAVFERDGINVQYRIPNMTRTESPLNRLTSGIEMLYAVLQSNSSGYQEDNLLLNNEQIGESFDIQDQYIADGDYKSAYIVKMQGLVEHLRYLMTFPENEDYTPIELPESNDDEDDYYDVVVSDGIIASAREIYEFLIGKGFTPESACAILGNMQRESSFNTGASNGTHFGLCQWGGGRWEALRQLASERGTQWTDLSVQLEFLWSELCGGKLGVKNAIINSTDMEEATDIFCRNYEVCGSYGIEVPKRYKYAKYWYNQFVEGRDNTNLTSLQHQLIELLNSLSSYSGIINTDGYCQAFVRTVFEKLGIYTSNGVASASDAESKWKVSSDINNIPVGATVYGKGSSSDGHVGIYIGNGMVVHNIGASHNCSYGGLKGIKCESINSWNQKYTFTSWGWQAGKDLSM